MVTPSWDEKNGADIQQAVCPSRHPSRSIKALMKCEVPVKVHFGPVVMVLSYQQRYSTSSQVSTEMGDHLLIYYLGA